MEIYKIKEFVNAKIPDTGGRYKKEILTNEQKAERFGGIFAALLPHSQTPYHFHENRESIIIAISGEAIEIVEGKEIPIKTNDVLFIPPKEKHGTVNRTDKEFRYLEFYTPANVVDVVKLNDS